MLDKKNMTLTQGEQYLIDICFGESESDEARRCLSDIMGYGLGSNFKLSQLTKDDYKMLQKFGIIGNQKNSLGHITNDTLTQELEGILTKCPAIAAQTKEDFMRKLAYAAKYLRQEQANLTTQEKLFMAQIQYHEEHKQNKLPITQASIEYHDE